VKDLVAIDPQTGKSEHCGGILKRRAIGKSTVWLTYDESGRMWWIVVSDECLRKIGFIEARREVCWELFDDLDEKTLKELRDYRPDHA
jgi:hypothetical protein